MSATGQNYPDPRMLSQDTLREYFDNPYVYTHGLGNEDEYLIRVDSVDRVIELETPNDGTAVFEDLLKNVEIERDDDRDRYRLIVEVGALPEVSYSLAFSVFKGMEAGRSFAASLDDAIAAFRDAIARKPRLSDEQVAGLYGELLVLEHLMEVYGVDAALESWIGPENEEHDFGVRIVDLEVKTTLSEKRSHVISSLDQLTPRTGVDLWLVSVQITRAGLGEGRSLDDLCTELLDKARSRHSAIRAGLLRAGWSVEDYGLYGTRFGLRNRPRAYPVVPGFPALTRDRLSRVVDRHDLVSDVRYRIDVSALSYGVPSEDLEGFVEEGPK